MNEYETRFTLRIRYAAVNYREAQARRNRVTQLMGKIATVSMARFGVTVKWEAERPKLVNLKGEEVEDVPAEDGVAAKAG